MKKQSSFLAIVISILAVHPSFAWAAASAATMNFVKNAAIGGQFEISSSQLALKESNNPDVKQFAQQMVDDHKQVGDQLAKVAASPVVGVSPPSGTLDAKHQQILDTLSKADPQDFDKKYVNAQIDAHHEAVSLFSDYAKNGDNSTLKTFAVQTLPTLEQHQTMADKLKAAE